MAFGPGPIGSQSPYGPVLLLDFMVSMVALDPLFKENKHTLLENELKFMVAW